MIRLNTILVLSLLFGSCQKKDPIVNPMPVDEKNLIISISFCPTIHCYDPLMISDLQVTLFDTREDAISATNPISETFTNEEGVANFELIDQEKVFIKTEYLDKGVYISEQSLNSSQDTHHEIIYKGHHIYNNNNILQLRQKHISFEYPTVGQVSNYKFHYQNNIIQTALPNNYEEELLTLEIIDQLDANSFLIKESLNTDGNLLAFYDTVHHNIWSFTDEGIDISTYDTTYTEVAFSFIFGENHHSQNTYAGFGFDLPYANCDPGIVDLESVFFNEIAWYECYMVADYEVLNTFHSFLRLDFDSLAGLDGDDRMKFYSRSDGIVRYIGINQMAQRTYGFDLFLE